MHAPYLAELPNTFESDVAELKKSSPNLFAEASLSEPSNYYESCQSDSSSSDSSSSCSSGGSD